MFYICLSLGSNNQHQAAVQEIKSKRLQKAARSVFLLSLGCNNDLIVLPCAAGVCVVVMRYDLSLCGLYFSPLR